MSKEDIITLKGVVTEVLPNAHFRVQLQDEEVKDHVIIAYTTGKMLKKRIRIMKDDVVTVEISPYDMERGRIVYRHK